MLSSYDLAIIGAGPAGMSAAITASQAGARVVVLDDKKLAGGQIYRNVTFSPLQCPEKLGEDYLSGQALVEAFDHCQAEKMFEANVWHVGENGEILFSHDGKTKSLTAREVIIGCGAMERPFPVPGWHLKGVMSAGSAQVMLKNDGLVRDDAIFVGTGPLLYLIVAQYLRLGVKVRALVDTTPFSAYKDSVSLFPAALRGYKMLAKGLGLLNEIRRSGVEVYRFADSVEVVGEEMVEGVRFKSRGESIQLSAEHLFLHQGVIPNLNMTRSMGLEHHWCEQQLCWKPTLDQWGQSSVPNVAVAGDSSGIVGADAAQAMGKVVALQRLVRLGLISEQHRDLQSADYLDFITRMNQFRAFIDCLYQPVVGHRIPDNPQTVVCRCEEQTVEHLKAGFEKGAAGPDELKGLTRCGMGPCQGRQCGHTVSELLASWQEKPVSEVGYYRLRSPMRLLNLTELSQFSQVSPVQQQEVQS